jgi:hypothetical protein
MMVYGADHRGGQLEKTSPPRLYPLHISIAHINHTYPSHISITHIITYYRVSRQRQRMRSVHKHDYSCTSMYKQVNFGITEIAAGIRDDSAKYNRANTGSHLHCANNLLRSLIYGSR